MSIAPTILVGYDIWTYLYIYIYIYMESDLGHGTNHMFSTAFGMAWDGIKMPYDHMATTPFEGFLK